MGPQDCAICLCVYICLSSVALGPSLSFDSLLLHSNKMYIVYDLIIDLYRWKLGLKKNTFGNIAKQILTFLWENSLIPKQLTLIRVSRTESS